MKSNLKKLRESQNLSATKLALKIGISRHLIYRIEGGDIKEVSLPSIKKICTFFNVPMKEVINIDVDKKNYSKKN